MQRMALVLALLVAPSFVLAQGGDDKKKAEKPAAAAAGDAAKADAKAKEAAPAAAPAAEAKPAPAPAAKAPAATAQQTPPKDEAKPSEKEDKGGLATILEYLDKGGWMMYVILIVSIIGMGIFFERGFVMFVRQRLNANGFIATIMGHIESRQYRQAIDACKVGSKHPLVNIMRSGIMRTNRREAEIERAMEKEMLDALPTLNKRIGLLSFLANSCTLLGLLGTIIGLIAAFSAVSAASAAEKQTALANGISTAMYTTAFGIVAAVPLLFFHHLLSARQEEVINEMESGATSLLVALCGAADEDADEVAG